MLAGGLRGALCLSMVSGVLAQKTLGLEDVLDGCENRDSPGAGALFDAWTVPLLWLPGLWDAPPGLTTQDAFWPKAPWGHQRPRSRPTALGGLQTHNELGNVQGSRPGSTAQQVWSKGLAWEKRWRAVPGMALLQVSAAPWWTPGYGHQATVDRQGSAVTAPTTPAVPPPEERVSGAAPDGPSWPGQRLGAVLDTTSASRLPRAHSFLAPRQQPWAPG